MAVEKLRAELEQILSSLTTSGFTNIDAAILEKINKCAVTAGELDMKEGKRLIENLSVTMKAIQEGKSTANSGNLRLTALDFYLKNQSADGTVEEL